MTATCFLFRLLLGQTGEEFRLRLEIIFHRAVKIEMVLGQVGEDGDVPFQSPRPLLRERVRRNLHRRGFASGIGDLREQFLHIERFGRGANGGQNALTDFVANGADAIRSAARLSRRCV